MNYENIALKIAAPKTKSDIKHKVVYDRNEIPRRVSNTGQLKWYVLDAYGGTKKLIESLKTVLEKGDKYADIRPYIGRILPMVKKNEIGQETKVGGFVWVEAIINKVTYDRIMSWFNEPLVRSKHGGFTTVFRGTKGVGDSYRGRLESHSYNEVKGVLGLDEKNREENPEYQKVMRDIIKATNEQKKSKKEVWDSLSPKEKETFIQDTCTNSIYFNVTKGIFSGMSARLPIHDYDDISEVCKNGEIQLYVDTAPGEQYQQLVWFYPDQLSIID